MQANYFTKWFMKNLGFMKYFWIPYGSDYSTPEDRFLFYMWYEIYCVIASTKPSIIFWSSSSGSFSISSKTFL